MSETVMQHKGTVDKYIGDSIMALFGAPVYHDKHEENAVKCAVEMIKRMKGQDHGFHMGIGISTGYVVTGMLGSINKREYTALGMPVNIAARLQKLAAPGEIIISEETKAKLDRALPFEKIGSLAITTHYMPTVYYKWTGNGQI
jgi:adenylate cyclase